MGGLRGGEGRTTCTMRLPCLAEKDGEAVHVCMPTAASATPSQSSSALCTKPALPTCGLLLVFAVAVLRSMVCLRMACMRAVWCSRHHFPGCTVPWLETRTRGICAVGIGSTARGRLECEELHEEGPSFLLSRVGVCEVYIVTCTHSLNALIHRLYTSSLCAVIRIDLVGNGRPATVLRPLGWRAMQRKLKSAACGDSTASV